MSSYRANWPAFSGLALRRSASTTMGDVETAKKLITGRAGSVCDAVKFHKRTVDVA